MFICILFILQKFSSHSNVICSKEILSVKTERDVELHLGIKTEPQPPPTSNVTVSKEKEGLVHQIDNLKAELQRVILAYRQLKSEYSTLSLEKENLKEEISAHLKQKDELQSLLTQLQIEYDEKKEQDANAIAKLTRENKTFKAQLKQLQTGISHHQLSFENNEAKSTSDADSIDDNVYEVEAINDHKGLNKNSRQYLVRWKGYGSDDDTWEKESSLNCPAILNKYKKMKNIK